MKEKQWSASQLKTYMMCPRKWAFKYVEHKQVPESPSSALGTKTHKELENYLTGHPINFVDEFGQSYLPGYIAASGIEHLPDPSEPGLDVEAQAEFVSPSGHHYRGRIDAQILDRNVPIVYDHKTTSTFDLYNETEETLKKDPQANIYAYDAMLKTGATEVDLQWTYMRKKGARKSKPVRLRVIQDDVKKVIHELDGVIEECNAVSEGKTEANEFPPNPGFACTAYGGCPFINDCKLTPEEKMRSIMGTDTKEASNDLLAKLAKRGKINPPNIDEPEKPASSNKPEFSETIKSEPPSRDGTPATLYIDCIPQGVDFKVANLAVFIEAAKERVNKAANVQDYRLIDYGKGTAMLLVAFEDIIKSIREKHLYIDSRLPESAVVLSLLQSKATHIVRGIR